MLNAVKNSKAFPGVIRLPGSGRRLRYRDMGLGVMMMATFVGFNICGVMTTYLQTDRVVLSVHPAAASGR